MGLSVTRDGAQITPPATLANPGEQQQPALRDLQARLSSAVRKAFDSSQVRVEQPVFTDLDVGHASANVTVVTHETARFSTSGFSTGLTSLADEMDEPVCEYVRDFIGGPPPPIVEVTSSDVELGEAALNATMDEGEADSARALSPGERLTARLISGGVFVLLAVFVAVVLAFDFGFPLLTLAGSWR